MLITFETKAYANITMFGDVAKRLINFMGQSGAVPSAILAEDLPEALRKLRSRIKSEIAIEQDNDAETSEDDNFVNIEKRAKPLIELLEAAIEQNADVMWDKQ